MSGLGLTNEAYAELAELARVDVQAAMEQTITSIAPTGKAPSPLAESIFLAVLSGAITAVANGLAGLDLQVAWFDAELFKQGMHDQLDAAFAQAKLIGSAVND